MKTLPLNEARAEFSKLVERALAGEPCRVTRYGKEAVVIVSEELWQAKSKSAPTLGALLGRFSRSELPDPGEASDDDDAITDTVTDRPWKDRPLGKGIE
jgi:antitoxin Phd